MKISKKEATVIADSCVNYISGGKMNNAWSTLMPVLNERTSFKILDIIGGKLGENAIFHKDKYFDFFDMISAKKLMGGYVVIAQSLISLLSVDCRECFKNVKKYMMEGNEWYVCDTFGERVLGYAMIDHYNNARKLFWEFIYDDNHWVQRSVGVAAHFFAKRCLNDKRDDKKAVKILELLTPRICERDIRVIKGIGWGLKTMGRYYPELLVPYIKTQIASKQISAVIIKKSVTYLDDISRNEIIHLYKSKKNNFGGIYD